MKIGIAFLILTTALIASSGPSGVRAQNLHQHYGGSWNCNRLSSTTRALVDLYKACKPCEDAGQEFFQDSESTGHCVGSRKKADTGSSTNENPSDVAKARLEEKDGDSDFRKGDWLGASVSYEAALKYLRSGGASAERIQRKMQIADCKEAQDRAKQKESKGDLPMAIAALSNGRESCERSGTDLDIVDEEIARLRATRDASRRASSRPSPSPSPVSPGPAASPALVPNEEIADDRKWAALAVNSEAKLAVAWGSTQEVAQDKATSKCHAISRTCGSTASATYDLDDVFGMVCCSSPKSGCLISVAGTAQAAVDRASRSLSDKGYSQCTPRQAISARTGQPVSISPGESKSTGAALLDTCVILGEPRKVSSMCDFKEGYGLFYTPVRTNPMVGCPAEIIVQYIDPDTKKLSDYVANRRGTQIETCTAGVSAVRIK